MSLVMVGTMLGGVFFPVDEASGVIRFIATVSPQSWAAGALKDILTMGVGLSSLATLLMRMTAIGMVLLFGGVVKLQMEG